VRTSARGSSRVDLGLWSPCSTLPVGKANWAVGDHGSGVANESMVPGVFVKFNIPFENGVEALI